MKKCDHCDNEATVHEMTVRNGVKIEKHLCEGCAAQQGIAVQPATPINELIKHYVLSHGLTQIPATSAAQGRAHVCPTCKTTFNEFRQHGLLGCPDCYRVFEAQLGPLLERAHDGGIKHAGKLPKRMLGGAAGPAPAAPKPAPRPVVDLDDRAARLRKIRRQLELAVAAEKYEEAAKLRDELKKMSDAGPNQPPKPA
ncbi:MAG TPA: UvrB/UvrC motif-containing protein [Phycisphaerales bacterium]|nr:UvrB/UvrC motif-containing protein [Phycisphaerales bacterium]